MKISYYLPDIVIDNETLSAQGFEADKIQAKTGISVRRICAEDQFALDLAEGACRKLFDEHGITQDDVQYLIYCTQSPDYILPNNSCILQDRLGLPKTIGATDITQGCSGFIYGLSLAKGILTSDQAESVLVVTAETYSKYMHEDDRVSRTIFGDGAAATFLTRKDADNMGPFVFGTDGSGAQCLWVKNSGLRHRSEICTATVSFDKTGNPIGDNYLFMNGPDIFSFTIKTVPAAIDSLLKKAGLGLDDIDLFVFHQANQFMLEHLRDKVGIPKEKFYLCLKDVGNTVSSTIPIALEHAGREGLLMQKGAKVMLVGFGIGFSWGATILTIH